ncbi:MAG: glycine cleavage system protein H [Pleomorphochaeta sp.]
MENKILFSESHEWVKYISEDEAYIGLSEYAAEQLSDIVFVDVYAEEVDLKDTLGDIESVKAVSEFYSPLKGKVTEVNQEILDSPQLINDDPENTWICKISNISDQIELMNKEDYLNQVEE